MTELLIGLVIVGLAMGLLVADMERKRRVLSEIIERLEPLVPRNRRLALHNLRRLSQSLFYAHNLMAQVERELLLQEKEKGIEIPVVDASRFSMRTSKQLASMYQRMLVIEGGAAVPTAEAPPATPPAEPVDDSSMPSQAPAGA